MEDSRFNPFPGLRPFQYGEQHLFFGREGQSEEILRHLGERHFLAVVGTSGSGKSSLIRAGLLPDLHGGFLTDAGSHWRTAVFRPIGDPIGNMARALNTPEVLQITPPPGGDLERSNLLLEASLRRSGLGLIEAVRQAKIPQGDNLLVVVDQFEELFRFATASNSPSQADDAAAFVKLLLEATWQTDIPIYIVITMRSDFIGDCARFRDLAENVTAGMYLIPRMTREQRRSAIADPVAVGGGCISLRLVNRLLNEVGDNPDQLPVLQHALMRTWEHWVNRTPAAEGYEADAIDFVDYEAIGGLEHALSNHADEAHNALPSEGHREIAKRMFQCLTEKGADNREIRRPTSVGSLAVVASASKTEVLEVVNEFHKQGRSFLTVPKEGELGDDALIDISHESLIRLWERLRGWVEEESESARMYRRLSDAATMEARHEGIVWGGPLLASALEWREKTEPNAEWAKRYDSKFNEAMAFLEKSRRSQRLRRVAVASVAAVLLITGGIIWNRIHSAHLREQSAQLELRNESLARQLADADAKLQGKRAGKMAERLRIQALREQAERLAVASSRIAQIDDLMVKSTPYEAANLRMSKAQLLLERDQKEARDRVIEETTAALKDAPESTTALTARGYAQMLQNNPKAALADFEQIRRLDPRFCLNYLNMTISLGQLGRIPEANKALDSAIYYSTHGTNNGLYFVKVVLDAYSGQRDFASDLKLAEEHLEHDRLRPSEKEDAALVAITWAWFLERTNTPNHGLSAGQAVLWEEADYSEYAARHFSGFLKTHQERKDARYDDLAAWVRGHGNWKPSETPARKPDAVELEVNAETLKAAEDYPQAEKLVSQAIEMEPKNVRLYILRMGISFWAASTPYWSYKDALDNVEKFDRDIKKIEEERKAAAKTQTTSPGLDQAKESPAEKLAKLQEDRKKAQATVEQDGKKMRAYYQKVLADCRKVVELQPDNPDVYVFRAAATDRIQAPNAAHDTVIRDLKHALELNPTDISALDWLSTVRASDSPEEAAQLRAKRDRLYPGDASNLFQLADLQNKLGKHQEAYDTIRKAIEINPANWHYYDILDAAEKGLGYSAGQRQRERAKYDHLVAEYLRRRGNDNAKGWEDEHWTILSELVDKVGGEEVRCNPDVTVCTTSRVTREEGDWALFGIRSVKDTGADTRLVEINHGKDSGIVAGTAGTVFARYTWDDKDKRPEVKIGTGDVISVSDESALVRVKLLKAEGPGLVRVGDTVGLSFRTPKAERSSLWTVLKFDIGFVDQNDTSARYTTKNRRRSITAFISRC
jgi:tetratricopeptide (TPR) repeat protein